MGYAGSQFHRGPGWCRDPLAAPITDIAVLPSGFYPSIISWAMLAEVVTTSMETPVLIQWWDADFDVLRETLLLPGTDATDTSLGIQRPNDYDSGTNPNVWYLKA